MKKSLIFIIIGLVVILGILWYMNRKKTKSVEPGTTLDSGSTTPTITGSVSNAGTGTFQGIPVSGTFTATTTMHKMCVCEQDPQVQDAIANYNAMPGGFPFTQLKPQLKAQILDMCPCVNL